MISYVSLIYTRVIVLVYLFLCDALIAHSVVPPAYIYISIQYTHFDVGIHAYYAYFNRFPELSENQSFIGMIAFWFVQYTYRHDDVNPVYVIAVLGHQTAEPGNID